MPSLKHASLILLAGTALMLAACSSTPGVRVERASAVILPADARIQVQGDNQDANWAAEQALNERGWLAESSALTLRTYTTITAESRVDRDPFCDPYGWRPYGWHPYSAWGGFHGACHRLNNRVDTYPVRTVTWALEDQNRQLLWYASARENRPAGPPLVLSVRLANALSIWRNGETR